MNNDIYKGGNRECLILTEQTVVKRNLRVISTEEFDIVDDYQFDGVDQQLVESNALLFIHRNAPQHIRQFFPKLISIEKTGLVKPTFSDTKLQEAYGFLATTSTTLKDLLQFPKARINYETQLILERVVPFEDIPYDERKQFLGKGCDFNNFANYYGTSSAELHEWLKLHTQQNYCKLDYNFIVSNWGIRHHNNFPVILDLGYFFFN